MGQRLSQRTPRTVAHDWNPVRVSNPDGRSQFVILCDHASNHIPESFGTLGLDPDDLQKHIAWDPGALGVSQVMSRDVGRAIGRILRVAPHHRLQSSAQCAGPRSLLE